MANPPEMRENTRNAPVADPRPRTRLEDMMKSTLVALACTAVLALSACNTTTNNDQMTGALVGGVLGAVTATALGADTNWLIVGTLAGAAAGALVAENQRTGECAYANGDGTYYRAPCP